MGGENREKKYRFVTSTEVTQLVKNQLSNLYIYRGTSKKTDSIIN